MGISTMARPKVKAKTTPAEPTGGKSIAFRATPAYAEWVDKLAVANRSTIAGLIDQALVSYAKEIEFNQPAPER